MSINVIRYKHQDRICWGTVKDGQILAIPGEFETTAAFMRALDLAKLASLEGTPIPENSVELLSPVTANQQFVCQGANYRQHMIDSGMNPDDKNFNMIFRKASSCIAPADTDIVTPSVVKLLDYEVELGLVFKRELHTPTTVTKENLGDFVGGVVIVNDVSARDIQLPEMQFYKGKSFRTFGPVGPYLCLLEPSEMHYLDELNLSLKVNGEVRQSDSTANLVFKPAETLTELSGVQDLGPGDLLATGTPHGCALAAPSPLKQKFAGLLPEQTKWNLFLKMQAASGRYLKPGDRIETAIRSEDGAIDLGVQHNTVTAA